VFAHLSRRTTNLQVCEGVCTPTCTLNYVRQAMELTVISRKFSAETGRGRGSKDRSGKDKTKWIVREKANDQNGTNNACMRKWQRQSVCWQFEQCWRVRNSLRCRLDKQFTKSLPIVRIFETSSGYHILRKDMTIEEMPRSTAACPALPFCT